MSMDVPQVSGEQNFSACFELVENFRQQPEPMAWVAAGIGYEGIGIAHPNPLTGEYCVTQAREAFETILAQEPDGLPTASGIMANLYLACLPLASDAMIEKCLSPIEIVDAVYLDLLARLRDIVPRCRELVLRDVVPDPALTRQRNELISALNKASGLGLLLRYQVETLQTAEWSARPAVFELSQLQLAAQGGTVQPWDVDVHMQHPGLAIERGYKIYFRSHDKSDLSDYIDDDVSVVWVMTDLATKEEPKIYEINVIDELLKERSKPRPNRFTKRLDKRTEQLLEVLDNRTLGLVRQARQ